MSDNFDRYSERLLTQTAEQQGSRFYGKYRGLVTDVNDPEALGRIKANVIEVFGDEVLGDMESPWAVPVVPFAGPNHGLVLLPEVGDGVWIEFEAGDLSRPLWTGGWWGQDQIPFRGDEKVRALVTTAGHMLALDDTSSKVQLLHSGGAELTMTDDSITLKIGSTKIVLSASGVSVNNGALEVR